MSQRLAGKVAIVVGAGSIGTGVGSDAGTDAGANVSNGAACAITFAREGAAVLCADRSIDAAYVTVRRIVDAGGRASAFEADVRDTDRVRAMVSDCLARYERIDVLHNNVGIEEFGELLEVTDESWDRVHAINLRGAMATSREVLPLMIRQGVGSIINMSSIASKKWSAMQFLSYSTSKAALNHMTKVVARQYAPHQVRCNAIVAGLIDTPHAAHLYPTEAASCATSDARWDARARHGTSPTPRSFWHRTSRLTSPASRWSSTAACRSSCI
jgi:NAD(P)-dependent dehydrogenase (short-subunit alcohol dehydrogenase family)